MKNLCALAAILCLFGLSGAPRALAAKSNGPKAKFFAKYDKNHNGVIDEDEKEAIRKDYAADLNGDLKRFDKNGDGKLDDDEIAAIKPPTGNGKKKSDKSGKTEAAGKAETPDKAKDGQAPKEDAAKAASGKSETDKTDSGAKPGQSDKGQKAEK